MTKCILVIAALILALTLSPSVQAQPGPPIVIVPGSPPGGIGAVCTTPALFYGNLTTGVIVRCIGGIWVSDGGGGATGAGRIACAAVTISGASPINFDTASSTNGPCNYIRLTTGAADSTLSLSGTGSDFYVDIIQGATARNVTLDGSLTGWCSISSLAGSVTSQIVLHEGSTWHGAGCPSSTDPSASIFLVNAQSGTYQVLSVDFAACKTITVASGTFTITLVASGSQPSNGQCISVFNYGSGVVTIARSGQNINGGTTSLTLAAASATAPTSAFIVSNGTNYFASMGGASSSSTTKLNFGFDFRSTSGYAADPAFAVFATSTTADATMAYPKSFCNALNVCVTAGWDAGASSVIGVDRFATGAQFQAGMCYITSGTATFRVDLPATGYYQVITVWGDPGYATTNNGLITDNGTTRITVTGTLTNGSTIQSFTDSASKLNSNGFWENTPVGVNFTSTIFRLVLAPGAGDSRIMHLRIVQQ